MTSPKRLARIAGVLYLLVGIFGGFAQGFVEPKMYVAGNAAATAGKVVANAGLVRIGVVADLFDATIFVFLALTLYVLLNHVHRSVARAMVVLVVISAGIECLNSVFEFGGLRVATDSAYAAALGAAGSNVLVYLLLDLQHYGLLIAQIFFGLWLAPLGYLAYKSRLFPKPLGVVLIVGAVGYIVDLVAAFLLPDLGRGIHTFVIIPPAIAEVSMVLYLLVIGVKAARQSPAIGELGVEFHRSHN
jgi:ABC-type amino acid transport substrate-binding protein